MNIIKKSIQNKLYFSAGAAIFFPAIAFAQSSANNTAPEAPQYLIPLIEKLVRVGVLVAIGLVLLSLLKGGVRKFEGMVTEKGIIRESDFALRAKTIGRLLFWLGGVMIVLTIAYMILQVFGFNVGPLLAGAGIIGLAFGFGGQYLIRDIISGLFILLEGQYSINDVVKIGEMEGTVENINLRTTVLRDLKGRQIIIPNGEVKSVYNFTRDYAYAVFNLGFGYKEDADRIMQVIKELGADFRKDEYFRRLVLEDLEMFGIVDLRPQLVTVMFRMRTLPMKQWEVTREFRNRCKKRFDSLKIEITIPRAV